MNNIDNLNNKKKNKNKGKLSSGETVNPPPQSQPSSSASSSELGSSTHQDLRWFSLSEDVIVTTAKSEELIGPLQPHLWGTNHHSNKVSSLPAQITTDNPKPEQGTTYANMRSNVKLCSHKVLNSSDKPERLPRYLTQQSQQIETTATDKFDTQSNYSYTRFFFKNQI